MRIFIASLAFAHDSAGVYVRVSSGKRASRSDRDAKVLLVKGKNAMAIINFLNTLSKWLFVL